MSLISVIIPTHQRELSLMGLLQSIQKVRERAVVKEILIVSNLKESFLETPDFLEKSKGLPIKIIVSGAIGVNKARNRGLLEATGEICLLLDDDCLVDDPFYFQKILRVHRMYPRALAIGGVYQALPHALPIDKAYSVAASTWQEQEIYGDDFSTRLVGGNVSYKHEILQKSGLLFDENLFFGGTEAEFHYRLMKKNYQLLLLPHLIVSHVTQLNFNSFVRKAFHQSRGYSLFPMDAGPQLFTKKGYHDKNWVKAFQIARHLTEYEEIIKFLTLYDWTYHETLNHPELNENEILSRARSFMLKHTPTHDNLKVTQSLPSQKAVRND